MPLQLKGKGSDNQSESNPSGDEFLGPIPKSRIQHEPMEIDSSEESSTIVISQPPFPHQITQWSSNSRTPSISTSDETYSRTHTAIEESVEKTREQGRPTLRPLKYIQPSQLRYPKSQYRNYISPLPVCEEEQAVKDLLQELDELDELNLAQGDEQDFVEFELSEFVVYLPNNRYHPYEIWSLHDLCSKMSYTTLLFDGILRVGNVRRYVQAVPFDICSIGNYGEDIHDVGDNIWIRSTSLAKSNVYYRLKAPAPEYARFYHGFLWLANLAKHFVDYSQWLVDKRKKVSVFAFRSDFSQWMQKRHEMSSAFQLWFQEYQGHDFRHAVASNIHFLFKESIGISGKFRNQPIWNELLEKNAIPVQEVEESMTVVTPYVYDCFEHLRFGYLLKSVAPKDSQKDVGSKVRKQSTTNETHCSKAPMPLKGSSNANKMTTRQSSGVDPEREQKIKSIQAGDILAVTKDSDNSMWKDETTRWKAADDCWYIYVQMVHESKNGKRSFTALWLYKSSDTCCAKMKYPFPNELFLSDNCTCSHSRIQEDEVLDIVAVEWHGSPLTAQEGLFVRQTYLENDKFETLKEEHKTCVHLQSKEHIGPQQKYCIGQTVLVPPLKRESGLERESGHALEPFEIISYVEDGTKTMAVLKHLLRRNEISGQSGHRPNELVYTDRTHEIDAAKIEYTCLVRFYNESDAIPTPYDRDGTGNAFYITTRLIENEGYQRLEPIQNNFPQTLLEGFNPDAPPHKMLRGLDLYCGGGNFGRGLEEGGVLHNEWAVDYAKTPMHSYYANLKQPASTKLFCGSVDDQLYQALCGNPKRSDLIPMPGEVDFISAGSPCQGFSALNAHKNNDKSLKNQSLVASVAAYIDFYRPQYGLLENVMTMAQKGLGRDEDVLSQLICAIVGLGYQLQLFVLDAWSVGSPQSRSRLFVSFAAPGLQPLKHPQLSHSHPAHTTSRGLGRLANGESFGHRIHSPTPFKYLTAYEATKDLPDIGDGQTKLCIPYPDHVMPIKPSTELRSQISVIPTHPRGSTFASTWNQGRGVMTDEQRALFPSIANSGKPRQCIGDKSKAWGRIHPRRLFPTIVVTVYPMDARMGTCLHWDQPRMMTVMEARRAQGFPDSEVLVGLTPEKWKVIGNSVPRTVSLALGLSLREAWLSNFSGQGPNAGETTTEVMLSAAQSNVTPTDRVKQLNQIRQGPNPSSFNKVLNKSNVGQPLGPLPLQPTAYMPGLADAMNESDPGLHQKDPLRQAHGINNGRMIKHAKILPPSKSLKRRHSMIQETKVLPPEKSYKTVKVPSRTLSLSTPSTDPGPKKRGIVDLPRDATTGRFKATSNLRKRLTTAFQQQVPQNREAFVHNAQNPQFFTDIDSGSEDRASISSSSSSQSRILRRGRGIVDLPRDATTGRFIAT